MANRRLTCGEIESVVVFACNSNRLTGSMQCNRKSQAPRPPGICSSDKMLSLFNPPN